MDWKAQLVSSIEAAVQAGVEAALERYTSVEESVDETARRRTMSFGEKGRRRIELAEDRARHDPVWAEKMARRHAAFAATSTASASVVTACVVRDGKLAARPPTTCSTQCPSHDADVPASVFISSTAQTSSTTTGDVLSVLAAPMAGDKALDVNVMGDTPPTDAISLQGVPGHSTDGEDPMAMSLTSWSAPTTFNAPPEASPRLPDAISACGDDLDTDDTCAREVFMDMEGKYLTAAVSSEVSTFQSLQLFVYRELRTLSSTKLSTVCFAPDVTSSIKQQRQVLHSAPWTSLIGDFHVYTQSITTTWVGTNKIYAKPALWTLHMPIVARSLCLTGRIIVLMLNPWPPPAYLGQSSTRRLHNLNMSIEDSVNYWKFSNLTCFADERTDSCFNGTNVMSIDTATGLLESYEVACSVHKYKEQQQIMAEEKSLVIVKSGCNELLHGRLRDLQLLSSEKGNIAVSGYLLDSGNYLEKLFSLGMGCFTTFHNTKHLVYQVDHGSFSMAQGIWVFLGDELWCGCASLELSVGKLMLNIEEPCECVIFLQPKPPWSYLAPAISTGVAESLHIIGISLVFNQFGVAADLITWMLQWWCSKGDNIQCGSELIHWKCEVAWSHYLDYLAVDKLRLAVPWDPGLGHGGMSTKLIIASGVVCLQGNTRHEMFSFSLEVEMIPNCMVALRELQPWPSEKIFLLVPKVLRIASASCHGIIMLGKVIGEGASILQFIGRLLVGQVYWSQFQLEVVLVSSVQTLGTYCLTSDQDQGDPALIHWKFLWFHSVQRSWFQFYPTGKASLYGYGAAEIQWEIAWPTTTVSHSIHCGMHMYITWECSSVICYLEIEIKCSIVSSIYVLHLHWDTGGLTQHRLGVKPRFKNITWQVSGRDRMVPKNDGFCCDIVYLVEIPDHWHIRLMLWKTIDKELIIVGGNESKYFALMPWQPSWRRCFYSVLFSALQWQIAWPLYLKGHIPQPENGNFQLLTVQFSDSITASYECMVGLIACGNSCGICRHKVIVTEYNKVLVIDRDFSGHLIHFTGYGAATDHGMASLSVPWDPGGVAWWRLEGKPPSKEGGMLTTTFYTTVGPARRWASWHWAGLGQQPRRKSTIKTMQRTTERLAWNGWLRPPLLLSPLPLVVSLLLSNG